MFGLLPVWAVEAIANSAHTAITIWSLAALAGANPETQLPGISIDYVVPAGQYVYALSRSASRLYCLSGEINSPDVNSITWTRVELAIYRWLQITAILRL